MNSSEFPKNESLRLAALKSYDILDTPPEPQFDDFTFLAANICNTPVARIAFQDETRNWIKSKINCPLVEIDRKTSFCFHTIQQDDVYEISDTLSHEIHRFNPRVIGKPHIRFYASAPIRTADGFNIGTISVLDFSPKKLTAHQQNSLRLLARQVMSQIELSQAHKTIQKLNHTLSETVRFSKNIIDNIPATIGYWDKNLICKYANQSYAAKYSANGIEIVGKQLSEAVNEALMQQIKPHVDGVLKGITQRFEATVTGKNQHILRTQVSYIPDTDEHGNVRGFYIFAQDITAIRHAEEESKLAEMAMETSGTGILITNNQHQVISANNTFAQMTGYQQSDLIGKTPSDLFDEASTQSVVSSLMANKDWRGEGQYRKKNGEYVDHFGTVSVLRDENGQVTHHLATISDLSEKLKLQQELTISQAMLERTGKIANVGGWEYDLRKNAVRWTEQLYVIHELENREPPSHEFALSFYAKEARVKLQSAFNQCANFGTPWDLELPLITAKGNCIWVRTTGEMIHENGQKVKIAGIFQDISIRKAHEQSALNKEIELRQTVVREVHHHIKNNIQGLSGILHNATHQYPTLATPINEAIGHLQSVAIIHGLQGKSLEAAIEMRELTQAISQNIQGIWQTKILFQASDAWSNCHLSKNEAVPVALILNELMTNAQKHSASTAPVRVEISQTMKDEHLIEVNICVKNDGNFVFTDQLDQDTERFGLKLMHALMPKVGASLHLSSSENTTQAILALKYPVIKSA